MLILIPRTVMHLDEVSGSELVGLIGVEDLGLRVTG
jgi:hypothetical protein